jgi:hypothetical protein
MPAPSTPEARNLHREVQALVEQAAVQQAESSVSRIRHQGSAQNDGDVRGPEASVRTGGTTERPANQGRAPVKEGILDTRGQAEDGDARNVINARRTGNTEAWAVAGSTHVGVGATTATRTARQRRSPREPVCSAGRSA